MELDRIYIDTSVVGGCLDEEFAEDSCALIQMARKGKIILLVSSVLADELLDAPKKVRDLFASIPERCTERVPLSPEAEALRDAYLADGVVGPSSSNDAHHVALATVSEADTVVSWNFRHIVHLDKIRAFNAVNARLGYKPIEIRSPKEVV